MNSVYPRRRLQELCDGLGDGKEQQDSIAIAQ